MMDFVIRTPEGDVSVTMPEFMELFEHRITLKQLFLRRELEESLTK